MVILFVCLLQLQTYFGDNLSFTRFPKRYLHKYNPHEQEEIEVLHGKLRRFRENAHGVIGEPNEAIQLGTRSDQPHEELHRAVRSR